MQDAPLSAATQERIKAATRAWMKHNPDLIKTARTQVNNLIKGKPCDSIPWIELYIVAVLCFRTDHERHEAAKAIYHALTTPLLH